MTVDDTELRQRLRVAEAEIERFAGGRQRDAPTAYGRSADLGGRGRPAVHGCGEDPHATDRHRSEHAGQPHCLRQPRLPGTLRVRRRRVARAELPLLQGPETDPTDVAKVREAVAARRDVVVELLNYHRDGTPFRNELYISPVFDPGGQLRYFFASQLDVTRFRTEEERLAENEARYQTLFRGRRCRVLHRRDAVRRGRTGGRLPFVEVIPPSKGRPALRQATGRRVSELVPDLERHWFRHLRCRSPFRKAVRFESGAVSLGRWFDVHALRIGDPARRHVAILFNDITDRRRLEGHLEETARERADERDMVWRASRDLFVVCGRDGRFRRANDAWTAMLGWDTAEVVGARFDAFVHPYDLGEATRAFERVILRQVAGRRRRAGEGAERRYRWVCWNAIPRDDHFYAAGRDITSGGGWRSNCGNPRSWRP